MADVKRRYNSERRREAARDTRRRILDAARRLFLAQGYAATTIAALAEEAGVAMETVYATFQNKRTVLARLVEVAVVNDDEPLPLLERSDPQEVLREGDRRKQITLFARGIREIMSRVGAIFWVMRVAAESEPEIEALLSTFLQQRRAGMSFFVGALLRTGPLRGDQDGELAADAVWALTSPEVFRLLTIERGWSEDTYEAWLVRMLEGMLLP